MTRGLDKGEVCILAGGLSDRMGRDKSRLRWRGKTLLQLVRIAARQTGRPVRVIRRDLVPRCGPLGGVYTALMTTRCERVLFLACDMPFVTGEFMEAVFTSKRPVFAQGAEGAGFPFLLPGSALPVVEEQLAAKRYSLQSLATRCRARKVPAPGVADQLFNINTPRDWKRWKSKANLVFPSKNRKISGC